MCYLCGREYGTKSLPIHIPQCEKKFVEVEKTKPARERRALPSRPEALDRALDGTGKAVSFFASGAGDPDKFNNEMYSAWENDALLRCPNCGRSFTDHAMRSHAKSCTSDKPAKPAGTALTSASLSMKITPGKISGTRRGVLGGAATPEAASGPRGGAVAASTLQSPAATPRGRPGRLVPASEPIPRRSSAAMGPGRQSSTFREFRTGEGASAPLPGGPAKFCVDCGTAYATPTAKFCGECGVRRPGM